VHLPEGYEKSAARYPVLFHLYGQQVTNYFADAVMTTERLAEVEKALEIKKDGDLSRGCAAPTHPSRASADRQPRS
jgi:predicted alpha/beta superfamily hydrolase